MSQENGKGFFDGLNIHGAVKLVTILIMAVATLYLATHDAQPNKTAIELAQEKTKQVLAVEKTKQDMVSHGVTSSHLFDSGSATSTEGGQGETCFPPYNYNLGSYVLNRGACVTFDNSNGQISQQPFSLGTASPIVSVEGDGDFVVFALDEQLSRCESDQTEDRCNAWISEHQKIGNPDARLHVPRYWLSFTVSSGKIIIKTAS